MNERGSKLPSAQTVDEATSEDEPTLPGPPLRRARGATLDEAKPSTAPILPFQPPLEVARSAAPRREAPPPPSHSGLVRIPPPPPIPRAPAKPGGFPPPPPSEPADASFGDKTEKLAVFAPHPSSEAAEAGVAAPPPEERGSKIGPWAPPGAQPEVVDVAPKPLSVLAVSNMAAGAPSALREAAPVEARRPPADAVELDLARSGVRAEDPPARRLEAAPRRRSSAAGATTRPPPARSRRPRRIGGTLRSSCAVDERSTPRASRPRWRRRWRRRRSRRRSCSWQGKLELWFDEMEVLKATMVAVAPFAARDKKLKETVDAVGEVMRTPGMERARGIVEGLVARVSETFAQAARGVPATYLEAQTEPMLLEGRCYQKRAVLGGSYLRGVLRVPGARAEAIPAYLAEGARNELPMFRRVAVRAIAEARRPVDRQDAAEVALRAGGAREAARTAVSGRAAMPAARASARRRAPRIRTARGGPRSRPSRRRRRRRASREATRRPRPSCSSRGGSR